MSYWFMYLEVSLKDSDTHYSRLKGNAVVSLDSPSFMPGSVKKGLEKTFWENFKDRKLQGLDVNIQSVMEIDKLGFDDWELQETSNVNIPKLKVIVQEYC